MSLRANCVALWKMNDDAANKIVVDDSDSGNNGEAQQNTEDLHTDGKINGALAFNSVSDYIRATIINCMTKAGTYSFSVWLYITGSGAQEIFQNSPASNDRNCMTTSTSSVKFGYYNGASWQGKSGSISTNQWLHVVGINNGGALTLYINNVLQTGGYLPYSPVDANYLCLGKHSGNGYFFGGKMDAVMIFDKALSEEEVAFLWNEGKGREHLGIARPLVGGSLASGRKGLV